MKKMRKIFTLLIGVLLFSSLSFAQGPIEGGSLSIPTDLTAPLGGDVVVPVITSEITAVGSVGIILSWNNAILTYKSTSINPKVASGALVNVSGGNTLLYGWFSLDGALLNPTDTILRITFTYNGGGCADLEFDTENSTFADTTVDPEPRNYNLTFNNGQVCQQLTPIEISAQPLPVQVCDNLSAVFSIIQTGATGIQWQVSTDGGSNFEDMLGENAETLTIDPVNPSMSDNQYRAILTNIDNSVTSDAALLTVFNLPAVTASAIGQELSADPGFVAYQWYLDNNPISEATDNTYSATIEGTYYVEVTDENGCTNISNEVVVTILPDLVINSVTATPETICEGDASTLSVDVTGGSGEYTYIWSPGDIEGNNIEVVPEVTTTYTVVVNDGISSVSSEVVVMVNPIPTAEITPAGETTFCDGGSVILNANTGEDLAYQWYLDDIAIEDATLDTYEAFVGGFYTVDVISGICVMTSDEVEVAVNPIPSIEIQPSGVQVIEDGTFLLLTANISGGTIQWYDANGILADSTNSTMIVSVGEYYAVVTDGDCSATSETVTIQLATPPVVDLQANPAIICQGETTVLTAVVTDGSGSYSYEWANAIAGDVETFEDTPEVTTLYSVTVTDLVTLLTATDEITVTVNPIPVVEVTPAGPLTINEGDTETLTATFNESYSYLWFKDDVSLDITTNTLDVTEAGTYKVEAMFAFGCPVFSNEVVVNVTVPFTISMSAKPSMTICPGELTTIQASVSPVTEEYSYIWSKNDVIDETITINNFNDNPVVTTEYKVTVTDIATLLSRVDSITVTVIDIPTAEITPAGPINLIQGNTTTLFATEGENYTYEWFLNNEIIADATADTLEVSEAGEYHVVISIEGCVSQPSNIVLVTVTPPLAATATAEPMTICLGENTTLSANPTGGSGSYSFIWSNAQTVAEFTEAPMVDTEYTVTVTDDITLEEVITSVMVTVNPIPIVDLTPTGPIEINEGESVVLFATEDENFTYTWYKDDVLIEGATADSLEVTETGIYGVIVTSENGCTSLLSNTVFVTVVIPLAAEVTAEPMTICLGENTTLSVNTTGGSGSYSFLWSNGQTIAEFTEAPVETTEYTVTVTDDITLEEVVTSVTVTVNPIPVADLSPVGPIEINEGTSTVLYATEGENYTYTWYMNNMLIEDATADTLEVTQAGEYYVVITSENGCVSLPSNTVIVTVVIPLAAEATAEPMTICLGENTTLSVNTTGGSGSYSFLWSNGQTIAEFTEAPLETTEYTVTVTDDVTLETVVSTVAVTVNPIPAVTIVTEDETTSFCAGSTVLISATLDPTFEYTWMLNSEVITDATLNTYTASLPGVYSVMVMANGCSNLSNEVTLTENPVPVTPVISGPTFINPGEEATFTTTATDVTYQWYLDGNIIENATDASYTTDVPGTYTLIISNGDCFSAMSLPIVLEVFVPCDVNVPTGLATDDIKARKVAFSWQAGNPAQDSVFIARIYQYDIDMNPVGLIRYRVTNQTNASMGSLLPSTNYALQVRSRCTNSDMTLRKSNYTAPVLFTTLEETCAVAQNIRLVENSIKWQATIAWDAVPGAVSYTVRYIGDFPEGNDVYHYRKVNTNSATLLWLKPGVQYTVQVKVTCAEGNKMYFNTLTFTSFGAWGDEFKSIATSSVENSDLYVYPNPSNGVFTVSVTGVNENSEMNIMNVAGQVVYTRNVSGSFTEDIDLSNLPKGMYFIKLNDGNSNKVSKIVLQ